MSALRLTASESSNLACHNCHDDLALYRAWYQCLECDEVRFCSECGRLNRQLSDLHSPSHHILYISTSSGVPLPLYITRTNDFSTIAPIRDRAIRDEPLHWAFCGSCRANIRGPRYKCIQCHDFDLCNACIRDTRHEPSHRFVMFFETNHLVTWLRPRRMPFEGAVVSSSLRGSAETLHNTRCNQCQDLIRGIRFKCLTCPEFNYCSTCFRRTGSEHPGHSFVKVASDSDIVRPKDGPSSVHHNVSCHRCNSTIYGTRYMCLHPACQSVNLCESCEALPGATQAHPPSHPLVKFKEDYTSVSSSSPVERDRKMPKYYWDAIFDFARSSGESLLGLAQDDLQSVISTESERTNECPICYEDMTGNEALGADCVHTLCCSCRERIVAQARVDRRRATCHACRLPYPRQEREQDEPEGSELVSEFVPRRYTPSPTIYY